MASGLSTRLTGQVGEFLVCAELGRRGILATPFAGNVPGFDVIATGGRLKTVPIQVKASNGTSWVTSLDGWLDIEFDNRRKKHVFRGKRRLENLDLIYVYVALNRDRGDRFYVLTQWRVREIIFKAYKRIMEPQDFRRPNRPESMRWAIHQREMVGYEDNWGLITDRCSGKKGQKR